MPNEENIIILHRLSAVPSEPFAEKQNGIRVPKAESFASANAPGQLRPIESADEIQELAKRAAARLRTLSV